MVQVFAFIYKNSMIIGTPDIYPVCFCGKKTLQGLVLMYHKHGTDLLFIFYTK